MAELLSFRVFLNTRLTAAAFEIFGAVEKTVAGYVIENDQLQRTLPVTAQMRPRRNDSLPFSVSEVDVPPEDKHCEGSPSLGQEDPEPITIKEEPDELPNDQEEEQNDSIFTPFRVRRELDLDNPFHNAKLTEYPTQWKMSKLQTFNVFLKKLLTASAAVEIFGAVEKMLVEYQEENDRLQRLMCLSPKRRLPRMDSLSFSLSDEEVPPEQQEWSPSLGQEDPGATQIKEEPGELWTSQEEEQLPGPFDTKDSLFTPPAVKSECGQEDPLWSLTPPQAPTVESRSKPVDLRPFYSVTHLEVLNFPPEPPDSETNASSHGSERHCSEPGFTCRKAHCCRDCGESFPMIEDLQRHGGLPKNGHEGLPNNPPVQCSFCKTHYSSTCKLKSHVRLCHVEKLCTCPVCGKTINRGGLSRHMKIHTGEKPFVCGECGKSFRRRSQRKRHTLTHTGDKLFSCSDCGRRFGHKQNLNRHRITHTGEKPFSCGECGKCFIHRQDLERHKLTHTGEKPFSCGDCGKSFSLKRTLTQHKMTHTGEKPFSCGDCGKSFSQKGTLTKHKLTHTKANHLPVVSENRD